MSRTLTLHIFTAYTTVHRQLNFFHNKAILSRIKSWNLWFCHLHFYAISRAISLQFCSYKSHLSNDVIKLRIAFSIPIKLYTHCTTPHLIHRCNLCCHRTSKLMECIRHCYSGRRSLLMSKLFFLDVLRGKKNTQKLFYVSGFMQVSLHAWEFLSGK